MKESGFSEWPNIPIARGTKCAFSSALKTYGRPWSIPHRRRASAPRTRSATALAARIGGVEVAGLDALEAGGRRLDQRRVGVVAPGVLEHSEAARDHERDAAARPPLIGVRARDHAVARRAEDPPRVGHELVVGNGQRPAAQPLLHGGRIEDAYEVVMGGAAEGQLGV